MTRISGWFAGLLLCGAVWAHDGLHERLDRVSREIRERPSDATLYVRRAALHREHRDWKASAEDLRRALGLDPGSSELHLEYALLCVDLGRLETAVTALGRALDHLEDDAVPSRVRITRIRGELRRRLGRHAEALADVEVVLASKERPLPDDFVLKARALEGLSRPAEALACLDHGRERLGEVPALVLGAVDLLVRLGRFEEALRRIDQQLDRAARKESWCLRRGDLLRRLGREEDAREAYRRGLQAIATLSSKRRGSPATLSLRRELRERLATPSEVQETR